MINNLGKLFGGLSNKSQEIIILGLAICIGSLPGLLAVSILFVGRIDYKNQHTEISIEGKKAANDTEHSSKVFKEKLQVLETEIYNLKTIGKSNPDYFIERVDKSFESLKPTATQQVENSEELADLVEEAIAE